MMYARELDFRLHARGRLQCYWDLMARTDERVEFHCAINDVFQLSSCMQEHARTVF